MKNAGKFSAYRFLIIGGTSKASTTSVFNYLAGHPQICPAEKETRFFLDADYPLPSKKRYQKNGPETYLSLFDSGPQENWRFEATPDYLYSANTPHVIHQTLANVRFIFILREPVVRLLSWYRFGRKRSEIGLKMTFDEYVAIQRGNGENVAGRRKHPAFYALQHGRYSVYLRPYLELFGKSLIHIVFYEELQRDPLVFMTSICRSVGIDETYFQGYRFDVANKGSDVRSPYLHKAYIESQGRIRKLARYTPALRLLLRQLRPKVDATYEKFNVIRGKKVAMSDSTKDFVSSYYEEEPARLSEMFGVEVPWLSSPQAALSGVEINLPEHRPE
jgi:hypothetical protein